MGAITALIIAVLSGVPLTGHTPKAYFWVLMIALIPQLVGHSGYNYVVGYFSATFISIVSFTIIVSSAILGYLLFRNHSAIHAMKAVIGVRCIAP